MEGEERIYHPTESTPSRSLPRPTLFSLTQSMNQLENLNIDSHRGHSNIQNINTPFKPVRKAVHDKNVKRAVIFPNLQRLQQPPQQQRASKPTPFFNLLKANIPSATPTPPPTMDRYYVKSQSNPAIEHGTKAEPSSDLEFSSPPSFREPPQMLPPPPPPTGPISRPGSRAGTRSRSNSSASFKRDDTLFDQNGSPGPAASQSTGLPDIAINALRELQTVTAALNDQRRQTESILSQLNSLSSTHEELKIAHETLTQEHDSTEKKLSAAQVDLASANDLATRANTTISATKDDLAASEQQLGLVQQELEATKCIVKELNAEASRVRAGLALEREEARKKFGKARKGLVEMGDSYNELQTMFENLKDSYRNSQNLLDEMRGARSAAADGLRVLEPLLDEGGQYARASEVKALVSELQEEVAGSHRVNDLLRDKLHHHSSQLAQANERVRELEESERQGLGELVGLLRGDRGEVNDRRGELLSKVEHLTNRLVKREEETIDVLAEVAGLETRLALANKGLEEAKGALEDVHIEIGKLRDVREEKRALEIRLEGLETRFIHEQEALRTALAELASARGSGQEQAAIIISLEHNRRVLEQEKTELIEALRGARAACKHSEDALAAESIRTTEARLRKEALEQELGKMKEHGTDREATLREKESSMIVLQERFDAQAITLRLAKEHCGDVQDACKKAEEALFVETAKEESMRTRLEALEEELTQVKKEAAGREEHMKAEREKVEEALAAAIIKEAVTQARIGTLEEELTKFQKESAEREVLMRGARKGVEEALVAETIKEALAQAKVAALEEELVKSRKEGADRKQEFRQAENRVMLLQDRYDAQTVTLRMAKEHSADLQERLTLTEASYANKLASATGRLETEAAVLMERNSTTQRMLDDVKREASTQQAAFVGASVDFEKKLAKQEDLNDRLIRAERSRGDALERETLDAKRVVTELEGRIMGLQEEIKQVASQGEVAEVEKVLVLKAMIQELEEKNRALALCAGTLKERYSGGDLSDDEKDFVEYLMKLSYSLHEQEDVAKENELRRRDNMIGTLQTRIRELESSLARLLKEKAAEAGGTTKSMVDLSLWMSSSPVEPDHSVPRPSVSAPSLSIVPNRSSRVSGPTTTPPAAGPSDSTLLTIRVPVKSKAKPKAKTSKPAPISKAGATFSRLAACSDSEDDVPLSELSDLSTVLGKRDRTPSPTSVKPRAARQLRTTTRPLNSAPSSQQQDVVLSQKKTTDRAKPKKKRKQ